MKQYKDAKLYAGDALDFYDQWDDPVVIVADGPYGVDGYEGDLASAKGLGEWYEPHVKAWGERSTPLTTLWFWNTELGWAEVHHVLKNHGWIYRACCVWDKGIGHAAGNTNTKTLRKLPVVTEVCVHYVRRAEFHLPDGFNIDAKEWLRSEWIRSGLTLSKSNEACGVANAATRKYLTDDHVWYFPPAEMFEKLVFYANEHGKLSGKPYFSIDGVNVMKGSAWERLRAKFYCPIGVTNVWRQEALRNTERIKINGKAAHPNQKPLSLMELIIRISTDAGDVLWEPFGGTFSASVAADRLGRKSFGAEICPETFTIGQSRFNDLPKDIFE